MKKIDSLATQVGAYGVWIPPLASTYSRMGIFRKEILNAGTLESKGWKSYEAALQGTTSLGTIPDPSNNFITEVNIKTQYKKTRDEFARLHLSSNRLLKKLSVRRDTSQPSKIEVLINGSSIYSETPIQGKRPSPIDFTCIHEILTQQKSADLFLIKTADLEISAEPWICIAWDMLQLILADVIYSAKSQAQIYRPTENNTISLDDVLIEVPSHSSWPGGHAFGAAALATLLHFLYPSVDKFILAKAATRIARNRESAGLHWEEDSTSGFNFGSFFMQGILENIAKHDANGELMQFFRYAFRP